MVARAEAFSDDTAREFAGQVNGGSTVRNFKFHPAMKIFGKIFYGREVLGNFCVGSALIFGERGL